MKLTRRLSLRVRLTLLFILLAAIAWSCASFVAWRQTTHQLNELFDTQQMLFARRLSALDFNEMKNSQQAWTPKKLRHGALDNDALAFAIFSIHGRMLMQDGENGQDIPWRYRGEGFYDGTLNDDDDRWRFLWLTTPDGQYRIVVGQEWEYRQQTALAIIISQLAPWLVTLPLMLILLIILLSRELYPLKKLTKTLRRRSPESADPLNATEAPSEVRPLVEALNQLFARTHTVMLRERRFTSDAAHELRSPLAALKVQTEVAQLSIDDPAVREKALAQMLDGIERASRLVDQLLTLSRLDSLDNLNDLQPVPLDELLQSAVMDIWPAAQRAGTDVRLHINAQNITRPGQPLLLSLLARNLLDNAIRYSPAGSTVDVTLDAHGFSVCDNGPGAPPEILARPGERFYRPPGQQETGSGLGLSIVKRIAALHRMSVAFSNRQQGGFDVSVRW